jgi:hypothetical protein
VDEAFSERVGKKCAATFEPLGFSRNGNAVVKAEPYFDYGEDKAAENSCVQSPAQPGVQRSSSRSTCRNFG